MRNGRRQPRLRLAALLTCVGAAGCANAPAQPEKVVIGRAEIVEHWGRMDHIVACGETTVTGHLAIHVKAREVNGGGVAFGAFSWVLIERQGAPGESREAGNGMFSNRDIVPNGDWEGWLESDGNDVTKDYDLTYEMTINTVATATGAITPLFVSGRVTHEACPAR